MSWKSIFGGTNKKRLEPIEIGPVPVVETTIDEIKKLYPYQLDPMQPMDEIPNDMPWPMRRVGLSKDKVYLLWWFPLLSPQRLEFIRQRFEEKGLTVILMSGAPVPSIYELDSAKKKYSAEELKALVEANGFRWYESPSEVSNAKV